MSVGLKIYSCDVDEKVLLQINEQNLYEDLRFEIARHSFIVFVRYTHYYQQRRKQKLL